MTDPTIPPILIAACGNMLAGDDAFGPLVARELQKREIADVEVLDLGMRPAALLDHLSGRRAVMLVDAAMYPEGRAGEILEMDFFASARPVLCADRTTSTHALSIAGQLELAQALGILPQTVRLLVLVVENLKLGTEAIDAQRQIDKAIALVEDFIRGQCMGEGSK
jgi:hydrogenase maturation protease